MSSAILELYLYHASYTSSFIDIHQALLFLLLYNCRKLTHNMCGRQNWPGATTLMTIIKQERSAPDSHPICERFRLAFPDVKSDPNNCLEARRPSQLTYVTTGVPVLVDMFTNESNQGPPLCTDPYDRYERLRITCIYRRQRRPK